MEYTVSEKDMLTSIIVYLESEHENELAAILQVSKFSYEPQWEFSGIISFQKKLSGTLYVPIECKKRIKDNLIKISKIACELYIDDEYFHFIGIKNVNMLPIQTEELDFEHKHLVLQKDTIFSNFIKFIVDNSRINELQKQYLFEACECGDKNNILSATVMLGASAEMLLLDLCNAYYHYLTVTENKTTYESFERKVLNARCAHDRLTEFLKRANSNAIYFHQLGFEDITLNFNLFDIIRQTRNDSGHPTGNTITIEQFKMQLTSYQDLLPKVLDAIDTMNSIQIKKGAVALSN